MTRTASIASTASELRIVIGQLVRRLRVEHRFPISQGVVLARLDREGPQTASTLAAAERVRPQSMAQTIAELDGAGLVARRPDPIDRRRVVVELTERGGEALAADRQRRDGWLAAALAELSPEERETLARAVPLLRRIAES